MTVFLVYLLGLGGGMEPWGIYSDINKAMQAQEDCQALHTFVMADSWRQELKNMFRTETCELAEFHMDGGPVRQPLNQELEQAPPVVDLAPQAAPAID